MEKIRLGIQLVTCITLLWIGHSLHEGKASFNPKPQTRMDTSSSAKHKEEDSRYTASLNMLDSPKLTYWEFTSALETRNTNKITIGSIHRPSVEEASRIIHYPLNINLMTRQNLVDSEFSYYITIGHAAGQYLFSPDELEIKVTPDNIDDVFKTIEATIETFNEDVLATPYTTDDDVKSIFIVLQSAFHLGAGESHSVRGGILSSKKILGG